MDLTTLEKVKSYGDKQVAGSDDALISEIITAMSTAIETYLDQSFGAITVSQIATSSSFQAKVDADGLLTFYPPYNPINTVTALQFRVRGFSAGWQPLNPENLDIQNQDCGPVLRLYGADFSAYRAAGFKLQVQADFTAGYASVNVLPPNLEFAARRLSWWAYKQRSAPMEKTAIPEMGVLIIPSAWPKDVLMYLTPYVNYLG